MQKISVNLKNDCDGNQLNYNNDLPAIIRNLLSSLRQPTTLWPKAPDFAL